MAGIRHKMASGETIRSPDPSQPSRSGRHRFPVKLLATTLEAGGNPLGMEDLALVTTADEAEKAFRAGKIARFIALDNVRKA